MKKLYLISICMGVALAFTSCDDEVELSSHQYDTVVTFKQEDMITFNFYNVNRDVTQTISINKGGCMPGTEPTITVEAYTEEELAAYNEENNTGYTLIPADQYSLSETSYKFGATENFKEIKVTIKGSFSDVASSQEGDYILPLRLKTDQGTVNKDKNVVYLKPILVTPTVSTNNEVLNNLAFDTYESESLIQKLYYDFYLDATNEWNFKLKFETENDVLQNAVEVFNAANDINYTLLPTSAYTPLEEVEFTSGVNDNYLPITIDATRLEEGDYLLPIISTMVGANFNIPETMYIHVFVYNSSGELASIKLDGRVTASSTHASEGVIENLWDDDPSTKWHSLWSANDKYDPKYGVYLDINLSDKPLNSQVQFGYTTRENINNNVPHMIQVYAGTSKDDLRLIKELDNDNGAELPKDPAATYTSEIISLGGTTTKLIRISFCKTYDHSSYGWGLEDLREQKGTRYPSVCISELNLSGR